MKSFIVFLITAFVSLFAYGINDKSVEIKQKLILASKAYNEENYKQALSFYENIINDPESFRSGGLKVIDRILLTSQIGRCHMSMGEPSLGLRNLLSSNSLRVKYKLVFDPNALDDYHDIASCYFKLGNPDKGNEWGEKYILSLQRTFGTDTNGKVAAWLFLFNMNLRCGDQAKALEYAKKISNHTSYGDLFDNAKDIASYLLSVCQLLYNVNDVKTATEVASNLEPVIAEKLPESRELLRIYNILTAININNPTVGSEYIDKAMTVAAAMDEKGEINIDMLTAYNNLASVIGDINPDQAAEIYSYIVSSCREHNLEKTDIYALALNGLALLKGTTDPESPELFDESFHILSENSLADISHLLVTGLNWIVSLDNCSRPEGEVAAAAKTVTDELRKRMTTAFRALSEGKRELYWQQISPWYQLVIPEFAYAYKTPELWQLLYDCLLQSRGILLTSAVSLSTIVRESGDPDLIALYKQYSGFEKDDNLAAALEARLLNESKKYGDYLAPFAVTANDVSASLKDNELAIEFVRYDGSAYANLVDSVTYLPNVKYLALLLNNKSATPNFVELCGEEELTGSSPGDLYNSVWSKIEPYLGDVDRIYFSPDGELFSLPLEYSRMPDGRFLWERYDCRRLSSTRELARQGRTKGEGIAIFGGMKYDMSVNEMAADAEKYRDVTEEMVYERGERDVLLGVMPLPGTLRESEEIGRTALTYMSDPLNVSLFKEKEATEAAFKSISGKRKQIIHIATHGFYNSPADRSLATDGSDETTALSREREMMRHSGLLFSGVDNVRYDEKIPEGVEDGVLDAGEISALDLHGTDLVTLSACRTALGEVSGDGVFGLQRGFKKAGAGSILMSLWKVDDDATCLFMTEFYNNLLNPGSGATGDKQKSLELARKAVMSRPDWHDFKYWGGFILLDAVH